MRPPQQASSLGGLKLGCTGCTGAHGGLLIPRSMEPRWRPARCSMRSGSPGSSGAGMGGARLRRDTAARGGACAWPPALHEERQSRGWGGLPGPSQPWGLSAEWGPHRKPAAPSRRRLSGWLLARWPSPPLPPPHTSFQDPAWAPEQGCRQGAPEGGQARSQLPETNAPTLAVVGGGMGV